MNVLSLSRFLYSGNMITRHNEASVIVNIVLNIFFGKYHGGLTP